MSVKQSTLFWRFGLAVVLCQGLPVLLQAFQSGTAASLAGDSFTSAAGPLNNANQGFGWAGPWQVQNGDATVPGYNIAGAAPLTYPGVSNSGDNYAIGGSSYQSAGRLLDTSSGGAFAPYLVNQLIGQPGQTVFFGLLMRKDIDTDDPMSVTLHPGNPPWWVATPGIAVGHFGSVSDVGGIRYWSLSVNGAVYTTEVPVVVGQTAFLVVQISFGPTTTASLYVNPPLSALPGTPSAGAAMSSSAAFQSVAFYGGSGASQSSIGELRFAGTYSGLVSGSAPPPAPPTNLSAIPGNASVALSWTPVNGAGGYLVSRIVGGVTQNPIPATTNSFTDSGLTNGITYSYFVVTSNGPLVSSPSAQVSTVPHGPAPAARPGLGTNLTAVADYNRAWPFVDAFKTARPWISQLQGASWGQGPPLQVNANGWITALQPGQYAETIMFDNAQDDEADYPAGEYTLLYDGAGTLSFDLQSATIVSQTPGRMVVNVPTGLNGIYLIESATDPQNPITNIRFILPGFESTYQSQPFHPLFLSRMEGYKVIRFMEWMVTNGSAVQNWSDRAMTSDYTYCWRGVPLEVMIQLANTLNINPWFNIPAQANDNYVTQFATTIGKALNPGLQTYIEYSNETWNSSFSQAAYIQSQGLALGFGTNPTLNGAFYTAYRSAQIFQIFQAVLGGPPRIIRVIASEAANSWLSAQTLGFQNAFANADVLAIAPYFNCDDTATGGFGVLGDPSTAAQVAAMSISQVNAIQLAHISNCALSGMQSNASVASSYGLKMVAYEGGQSLVGYNGAENNTALTTLFANVNRGSGMSPLYAQYLLNWVAAGGDMFVHYSDIGAYAKYGSFGAMEYQDQDPTTSPKYQSLMTFAAQYP